MNIPAAPIPSSGELRRMREDLSLSQSELSDALGFGKNGAKTIRDWEHGWREGAVFKPTPTAWVAFRYLTLLVAAHRQLGATEPLVAIINTALPDALRDR
jgi:hypothetical protein